MKYRNLVYSLWGIILFLFVGHSSVAQTVTLSGYVYERGSLELLPYINVYEEKSGMSVFSNEYGFYVMQIPYSDTVNVIFSGYGYAYDTLHIISPTSEESYNPEMIKITVLEDVIVRADRLTQDVQMSTIQVTAKEVKAVPILLGEKDLFKTLMLMPGVQSGNEGTSGIYVRGGGPDQNLIILDEATIYNANHLLGFFSIFNGDAIKSVELVKGGFPARYGGRLSSVIDVHMKEGNKTEYHGEGGIGIISSHLMVEGPIVKNKASFMLSGRTTYFDLLARPLMKILSPGSSAGYYFFDLNAKFNYDISDKNKLYLSAYFGRDKFHLEEFFRDEGEKEKYKMGLYWQNATATARWNHLFTSNLFSNLTFVFSDYTMDIYDKYKGVDYQYSSTYKSGIRDYTLKYDLTYVPDGLQRILVGAAVTYHQSCPSAISLKEDTLSSKQVQMEHGLEYSLYAEDEINIRNKFRINPGIRLTCFSVPRRTYFSPEPRLSMSYNFLPNLALKASYAMMSQSMLLLSTSTIGLPTDLWVPVTANVKPQRSQQVALGLHYDLYNPSMSFSVEGYYKHLNNVLAYKEGASFFLDALEGIFDQTGEFEKIWSDNVTAGKGWSYGVEFLVRKNAGKFTGWIGYTLSWTQQQFDDLNFGRKFFARYDRRHDVSIVLMYSPTKKINLSLAWVFATGNAVTLPVSVYQEQNISQYLQDYLYPDPDAALYNDDYGHYVGYVENYSEKNNLRMQPFHHLDIGAQFIVPHKKKGESIFEVSIYNVYNYKNAFFYFVDSEYDSSTGTSSQVLKKVCIFPIIPSFTYHFRF
ncbi:MAG: TonB-dependent receptor [Bacteroidales bacterium]|nr:TonB-dependent receptor [Bacteroidales bacterium]